jgi:hypothetical protein
MLPPVLVAASGVQGSGAILAPLSGRFTHLREVELAEHHDRDHVGEEDPVKVSEGLGGVTGAALGIGLGALLGPAGMIVGGLAGGAGGWWAGKGVADAASDVGRLPDDHFRRVHDEQHADRCDYDDAACYYRFGTLARRNPDYQDRDFDEVEPELRRGWQADASGRFRTWDDVRPFVRTGYSTDLPRD